MVEKIKLGFISFCVVIIFITLGFSAEYMKYDPNLVSKLLNTQSCITQEGNACIFPFKYKNKTYSACSTEIVKPGKLWCSTSVDENGKHQKGKRGVTWGLCSSDCPVDGDQECTEGKQCVYRDDCPQFQEFLKLSNTHPDKQIQIRKWKASVCNKKGKRLCCPIISTPPTSTTTTTTTDDSCSASPVLPGDYLPRSGIDRCGKNCLPTFKRRKRASGGVNAKLGEFPWAALLGYRVRKRRWDYTCQCQKVEVITKYRCGGTLINNRYVLTAAQCHRGNSKVSSVVLGEWEVGVDPDCSDRIWECLPPSQSIEVESVTIHENYIGNIRTGEVLNDIALIRLKQPVVFNKAVQPICLPLNEEQAAKDIGADNLFDGIVVRDATVIGWGTNGTFQPLLENSTVSQQILQKIEIPIISNQDCKSKLSDLGAENVDKKILPTHVCADPKGSNKESCKGDGGGGMFVRGTSGDDSISYQIGMVSFGLNRHCGLGYSEVYTRITEFVPWIKENIHM